MDLKEIQPIILFAKKNGVKSMTISGLSFEFFRAPKAKPAVVATEETKPVAQQPKPPTLDDINAYIYEVPTEAEQ